MAITIGNTSFDTILPGASSWSRTLHVQNAGTDPFLYVELAISATWSLTNVTWDGTPMNLYDVNQANTVTSNVKHYRYYLANPSTGLQTIEVTFDANYTTSFVWHAQSLLGTSAIADSGWTNLLASPNTDTTTVANGDVLVTGGLSAFPIPTMAIDGVTYSYPGGVVHANVESAQYIGKTSPTLTAGSVDVSFITGAPSLKVTNSWVKFSESVAPPGGTAEGSWWLLMRLV
jgi:hypothetical protein